MTSISMFLQSNLRTISNKYLESIIIEPSSSISKLFNSPGTITVRMDIFESLPVKIIEPSFKSIQIPDSAGNGEKTLIALETIDSLS